MEVRHHMIPISLNGRDSGYNIMTIKENAHKQLHRTLDIEYRKMAQIKRRIRQKYNHKLITTPDEIDDWTDVQRLFLDRLNHLPIWLQKEHVLKMMEQAQFDREQYESFTWEEFDKPNRLSDRKEQVYELHRISTEAQKALAQMFIDTIKRKHYQKA